MPVQKDTDEQDSDKDNSDKAAHKAKDNADEDVQKFKTDAAELAKVARAKKAMRLIKEWVRLYDEKAPVVDYHAWLRNCCAPVDRLHISKPLCAPEPAPKRYADSSMSFDLKKSLCKAACACPRGIFDRRRCGA